MAHQGFGFCEFLSEEDADYACKIMNQIKLFGKPLRANKASYDKKQIDVGANLFIGNLGKGVSEQELYDTFQRFGAIAETPKVSWRWGLLIPGRARPLLGRVQGLRICQLPRL